MLRRGPSKPSPAILAAQATKIARLSIEIEHMEKIMEGKDADAIVKRHIELLHTYNEIKDGVQSLIGRYAVMIGTTVKDVHEQLGLSLTE